jgi:small subunit ribosomal protein S3
VVPRRPRAAAHPRADLEFGYAIAKTTYGVIGVKVWVFKGEILDQEVDQ